MSNNLKDFDLNVQEKGEPVNPNGRVGTVTATIVIIVTYGTSGLATSNNTEANC